MSASYMLSKVLSILLFRQLSSTNDTYYLYYPYYQNISFDLVILFENSNNLTIFEECKESVNGCDEYFGTINDTSLTLHSINKIFESILILYHNKSSIIIIQTPKTKLMDNVTFINCSASSDVVTLTTHFCVNTMYESTNIVDEFFIDSSKRLFQFFSNVPISLSFHHQLLIVNQPPRTNVNPVVNYSNYLLYLLLLLVCPIMLIMIVCIRYRQEYQNAFVVDKALVLIIGISQFDDKMLYLPGVKKCVDNLVELWRDKYKYDVFV
eukprot:283915_1